MHAWATDLVSPPLVAAVHQRTLPSPLSVRVLLHQNQSPPWLRLSQAKPQPLQSTAGGGHSRSELTDQEKQLKASGFSAVPQVVRMRQACSGGRLDVKPTCWNRGRERSDPDGNGSSPWTRLCLKPFVSFDFRVVRARKFRFLPKAIRAGLSVTCIQESWQSKEGLNECSRSPPETVCGTKESLTARGQGGAVPF